MTLRRREFIGQLAAGGAAVSMPLFLSGCGIEQVLRVADPVPVNPFMQWFGVDDPILANVMAALTANGADMAELFFQHRRESNVSMRQGAINRTTTDIIQGVGLRVVRGQQSGFAYTEDLTLPAMLAAAKVAAKSSAAVNADFLPRSFAVRDAGDRYLTVVPWADVAMNKKRPLLDRVDRNARAADPSVSDVSIAFSDIDERVMIATHDGQLITDHRPMTRLSASVTATRRDETRSGYAGIAAREELSWYTDERVDQLVDDAVARTLILFEARQPRAAEVPVILAAGAGGILLHEAIGHAFEADFNLNGTSRYAGKIGERIAAPSVTLVDDGTVVNERGALNYDDEGSACDRQMLVENGMLRSYLHDSTTARQYGVTKRGSARRESFRHVPMPRMTCTSLENGPHTRQEVIAAVDYGIITETFTSGQVEIGAGDYSFYIKNGWLVEKGRVTAPLRDMTVSGNGPETLQKISMVADDAAFDPGGWTCGKNGQQVPVSQGMPTTLVSNMKVDRAESGNRG